MSIVFKAQHPIFGRGKKPLGLSYQQRSPYYWWWEFLRRNDEYAACCDSGGTGDLAGLYADFGVVSNDNFKEWWTGHGFRLFAEQAKPVKLAELDALGGTLPVNASGYEQLLENLAGGLSECLNSL